MRIRVLFRSRASYGCTPRRRGEHHPTGAIPCARTTTSPTASPPRSPPRAIRRTPPAARTTAAAATAAPAADTREGGADGRRLLPPSFLAASLMIYDRALPGRTSPAAVEGRVGQVDILMLEIQCGAVCRYPNGPSRRRRLHDSAVRPQRRRAMSGRVAKDHANILVFVRPADCVSTRSNSRPALKHPGIHELVHPFRAIGDRWSFGIALLRDKELGAANRQRVGKRETRRDDATVPVHREGVQPGGALCRARTPLAGRKY